MKNISRIFKIREFNLATIVFIFILILSFTAPNFISKINLLGMLLYISENTIIIGAMTIIIIGGKFDLSVGSVLGFSGMLVGVLIKSTEIPIPLAIIITLVVAAGIGAINGTIISYININPFITTLATWFIFLSLKYVVNGGINVSNLPDDFNMIAQYRIIGIPFIVIIAFIIMIIFEILLRKNVYFRQNYFIGGNEEAASLIGIKVKRVITFNYVLIAIMAGIAGILSAARYGVAYTSAGTETAFILIIGVILGGASLYGGSGSVLGSMLGLIIISLIYNAIIMYGINLYWNQVVLGLIIIIAVIIDVKLENRKKFI